MKIKVYNLVILDASGSMNVIREQAISGINETIQSIKLAQRENPEQEHYFSFVSFNNKMRTVADCQPIEEVVEISEDTYRPEAMTALYDAMGLSLLALESKISADDRVLVTIITDGMENASQEFTGTAVKTLVERLKSKGWVFAYIGANQDVEAVAAKIAIKNTMSFEATEVGTCYMMKNLGAQREKFYKRMSCDAPMDAVDENENFFKK